MADLDIAAAQTFAEQLACVDCYVRNLTQCSLEAGAMIQRASQRRWKTGEAVQATTKASSVDMVTATDHAVEQLIFGRLRARFPDHDVR